jgi:DNA-binding IclR family transcriptional regulator
MARTALSASRAVATLNFLAAHPTDAFTLSDLADRLGINLSSMHAVLSTLTDAGYVARHPRLRTYALGPAVVALGTAALERHSAIDLARNAAKGLATELGLETTVTAPAGDEIVFLARAGAHQARGMPVHVGQRVPLAPPLGSVFVAWGGEERWFAHSDNPEPLRAVLADVQARGYAIAFEDDIHRGLATTLQRLADRPADTHLQAVVAQLVADLAHRRYHVERLDPGATYDLSMIAAPIFGTTGEVVLALSLTGFPPNLPGERAAAYGQRLRDAGVIITKQTAGRLPPDPSTARKASGERMGTGDDHQQMRHPRAGARTSASSSVATVRSSPRRTSPPPDSTVSTAQSAATARVR